MRPRSALSILALAVSFVLFAASSPGLAEEEPKIGTRPPSPQREFGHHPDGPSYKVSAPGCTDDPQSHHCFQSNKEAVDIMYPLQTNVYAVADSEVVKIAYHPAVGNYIVTQEVWPPEEGLEVYMTFEHLDSALISVGERLVPGELFALSGDSGNAQGHAHLHFQRGSVEPTFTSADQPFALRVPPIDGRNILIDDDLPNSPAYASTNAGVGYDSNDSRSSSYASFQQHYTEWGTWQDMGRPWAPSTQWMPCRTMWIVSTHWRYGCKNGSVQMLQGSDYKPFLRAMMKQVDGSVVTLWEQFLYAYTEVKDGYDWVEWLGYPTIGDRRYSDQPGIEYIYITFEFGQIRFFRSLSCRIEMHAGLVPPADEAPSIRADATYNYCGEPQLPSDRIIT